MKPELHEKIHVISPIEIIICLATDSLNRFSEENSKTEDAATKTCRKAHVCYSPFSSGKTYNEIITQALLILLITAKSLLMLKATSKKQLKLKKTQLNQLLLWKSSLIRAPPVLFS
ncbi:hypothetical protein [Marinomonas communis]|uniref:hypothetical protein n=1 Tax=Marinomonas communis TaxID=28254 RepID=UPI0013C305B9|nr:hypothetical protein [Marinomonas communis]